jgi:hypothetical protein
VLLNIPLHHFSRFHVNGRNFWNILWSRSYYVTNGVITAAMCTTQVLHFIWSSCCSLLAMLSLLVTSYATALLHNVTVALSKELVQKMLLNFSG